MIKRNDGTDMNKEKMAEKMDASEKKSEMLETDTEKMLTSNPKTNAQKLWEEIRNKKIEMFSIPNQTVGMHVKPKDLGPDDLYITLNSGAALPALEKALGPDFEVEVIQQYIKISRKK